MSHSSFMKQSNLLLQAIWTDWKVSANKPIEGVKNYIQWKLWPMAIQRTSEFWVVTKMHEIVPFPHSHLCGIIFQWQWNSTIGIYSIFIESKLDVSTKKIKLSLSLFIHGSMPSPLFAAKAFIMFIYKIDLLLTPTLLVIQALVATYKWAWIQPKKLSLGIISHLIRCYFSHEIYQKHTRTHTRFFSFFFSTHILFHSD